MTHHTHASHGLFSLALASRCLTPNRIARESATFEPRPSRFAALKARFAAAAMLVLGAIGLMPPVG